MITSSKQFNGMIFFETVQLGNAVVEFGRNSNEICLASILKINGIKANPFELGVSKDINPEKAPPTGCGNRVFIGNYNLPDSILEKYQISRDDMNKVLKYLEERLKIGACKYCT